MQAIFFGSRPHELVRATFREVFSELTKLQQDIFSFCVAQPRAVLSVFSEIALFGCVIESGEMPPNHPAALLLLAFPLLLLLQKHDVQKIPFYKSADSCIFILLSLFRQPLRSVISNPIASIYGRSFSAFIGKESSANCSSWISC